MKKVNINKFNKIITFLRTQFKGRIVLKTANGTLSAESKMVIADGREFKMSAYHSFVPDLRMCNTAGCVVGCFPLIFPKSFSYETDFDFGIGGTHIERKVVDFLGIENGEYAHLFLPNCQAFEFGGNGPVLNNSTPKFMAQHIEKFVISKTKK